ncbi:Ig-like domain-containing protein [Namhaeicola litoreus]|uniref:Ig-like domain-containing protein n=1 Tax=Namhaeicola litoreus TaxID=1052145 RepID=A0ABW3Y3R1_9FLAO
MRVYQFFILLVLVSLYSCARRGRPEGGPIDEDKPIMVKSDPEFGTTNFKGDEIKIYFDEFIKLKDISQQLIVSPPLKYPPIIVPQGTASKFIDIKIMDTLFENTTYTFNFGQSVIDNTEGNILDNFRFVISTGDYIDSLNIKGTIKDAFKLEPAEGAVVILYPYSENFNDSIVFTERPTYVGAMTDSINFEVNNIKQGKYALLALTDKNRNFKYNKKEDKIAFYDKIIEVPSEDSYVLELFTEDKNFRLPTKPSEISKGLFFLGYEGNIDSIEVRALGNIPTSFKEHYAPSIKTDTIKYWFSNYEKDSLELFVRNRSFTDTITLKIREDEIDSLKIESITSGNLDLRDTLKIVTNNPVFEIDTSKIKLFIRDSIGVDYNFNRDKNRTSMFILFEKEFDAKYKLNLNPGALTDIFGTSHDSIRKSFTTKRPSNYSSIYLTINNIKEYPVIVQLVDQKGEGVASNYLTKKEEVRFENIKPGKFKVRLIYDKNKNGKWDSGDYLKKIQPEKVVYFKNILTANANWEIVENLTIE